MPSTIMRNIERLAWKPSKKPTPEEIVDFVQRTGGGSGELDEDKILKVVW